MLSTKEYPDDTVLVFDDKILFCIVERSIKGYTATTYPSGLVLGDSYASAEEAIGDVNLMLLKR